MKNRSIRIIIATLLTILMLLSSVSLIGCDKGTDTPEGSSESTGTDTAVETTEITTDTETDSETSESTTDTEDTGSADTESADTEAPETEDTEAPAPQPVELTLFEDGKTDFTIVIANGSTATVSGAANELASAFKSKLDIDITVVTESAYKESNGGSISGSKIVFGTLAQDVASIDLKKSLRPGEYVASAVGDSFYFAGSSDDDVAAAVAYFSNNYLKASNRSLVLSEGDLFKNDLSDRMPIPNMTISGNEIWRYKIVYDDTYHAQRCANNIQLAIADSTGYKLDVVGESTPESKYEILVGKTNRAESDTVRGKFARPNVYYEVTAVGDKAVFMAEGYATLTKLSTEFNWYMIRNSGDLDIATTVMSGDIIAQVDPEDISMFERAEGTDLRVLHWNMAAPYLNDANKVYTDNKIRGEVMADMILQFLPDIITTNEIYLGHAGGKLYDAVMKELLEYYNILDQSPYEIGKPNPDSKPKNQFGKGPTIHENILYKKDLGFTVKWSGWRYNYENVYYHGYHTAVFTDAAGKDLLVSVGHYADARTSTRCPEEHNAAIADAKAASGVADNVTTIVTGDMYTWNNNSSGAYATGYNYWVDQGYTDSQVSAKVNANNTIHYGTFHTIGKQEGSRAGEDFIWTKNGLSALCYKVLSNQQATDTSDHYPVMADLKFN